MHQKKNRLPALTTLAALAAMAWPQFAQAVVPPGAAAEIVSLQGIGELRKAFPRAVIGFSDHSIGPEMAIASVALGACILERHFTDTRYRKGPDIPCSMDPAELRFLIDRSREVHTALMNPKVRTGPEEDVYRFARGSVVADKEQIQTAAAV
mgnify:CR=1 FL=1